MVAEATTQIIVAERYDLFKGSGAIYHLSAAGKNIWYGFASSIINYLASLDDLNVNILQIATSEFNAPTMRPAYSVLNNNSIHDRYLLSLPHWEDAYKIAISDYITEPC